jgi:hypothetical protein
MLEEAVRLALPVLGRGEVEQLCQHVLEDMKAQGHVALVDGAWRVTTKQLGNFPTERSAAEAVSVRARVSPSLALARAAPEYELLEVAASEQSWETVVRSKRDQRRGHRHRGSK